MFFDRKCNQTVRKKIIVQYFSNELIFNYFEL